MLRVMPFTGAPNQSGTTPYFVGPFLNASTRNAPSVRALTLPPIVAPRRNPDYGSSKVALPAGATLDWQTAGLPYGTFGQSVRAPGS